jgi:hypothetical protein
MVAGRCSSGWKGLPMWSQFLDIIRNWRQDFTREVGTWEVQEWFLANVVVLIFGCFLLKGLGSRKNY